MIIYKLLNKRLWQSHGQTALESSHLCLLNASALGSEVLKNLVLPGAYAERVVETLGLGSFTLVDHESVTEADLGSNFFLPPESLGKSRAEAMVQTLLELNDEVSGNSVLRVCYLKFVVGSDTLGSRIHHCARTHLFLSIYARCCKRFIRICSFVSCSDLLERADPIGRHKNLWVLWIHAHRHT